ncbi:MAG: hypothetical protein CMH61_01270 [Nanoarchaeota archaeon]|nr:hypothetical protein [Nanoarchaeota archaeon]
MRNLLYSALVVGALALATCDDSQPFHPEPDAATSEYIACPEDVYVDCLSEEEIEVLRNLAVPPAVANTVVHHSWIVEMAKQDGGLERLAEIDETLIAYHPQGVPEKKRSGLYNLSRQILQEKMPLEVALEYHPELHRWNGRESEPGPLALYAKEISAERANAYLVDLRRLGISMKEQADDNCIGMSDFTLLLQKDVPADIVDWYMKLSNSLVGVNITSWDIIELEGYVRSGRMTRDDISDIAHRQFKEIDREHVVKLLR